MTNNYENTSESGNLMLGARIKTYWATKTGMNIKTTVLVKNGVYCLCSNLYNGLPRESGRVFIKGEPGDKR